MAKPLYKITAKKNNGSLLKGMTTDVVAQYSSKLRQQEIADALNQKYNSNIHHSKCGLTNFEIQKLN
ncbi:hypothetical protein [Christiangramia sp. SM2212]|uniref:GIY-YIG homing endonuclease n=1 Tax=Christiangramia sediminicola TaxID=3073267 RepID=A0ABU1EU39_9FLAO|nr:hypothetical protein [Christiangramia sp. SM2212]MDR5591901.1 hypothetical protein [Christiangramia sp. SM2212]